MKTELQMQWKWEQIKAHNTMGDAWIVLDGKVYDITTFLKSHPGGKKVMEPYLGGDISLSYRGKPQKGIKTALHKHAESSVSLIQINFLGYLEGCEATKSFTSPSSCLDTKLPILPQLGKLGSKYYDVIDSPLHLHESARIFEHGAFGDCLEWMSRTNWWLVPSTWIPITSLLLYAAYVTPIAGESTLPLFNILLCVFWGVISWTMLEFILHRWMFHVEHWMDIGFFSSSWFIQVHFVMHGVHHLFPSDAYRLVMPPWNASVIAGPIWFLWAALLPKPVLYAFFAGLTMGYISYDMMHYFLHFGGTKWTYLQSLRTHHMVHHYTNVDEGYGVSSKLWDYVLGDLGVRAGIPTASFGRWSIDESVKTASKEAPLFKYHFFVAAVVWFVVPMWAGSLWANSAVAAV